MFWLEHYSVEKILAKTDGTVFINVKANRASVVRHIILSLHLKFLTNMIISRLKQ